MYTHDRMAQLLRLYSRCLSRAPTLTNCLTGFLIAGAGDYACQRYFEVNNVYTSERSSSVRDADSLSFSTSFDVSDENQPVENQFQWNWRRSLDMGFIRATLITPFVLQWYPTLIRLCPGSSPVRVLGRVALDQFIGSPVVICLVFTANAILQRDNMEDLLHRVKEQFLVTWKTGFQYWPFIHCINFGFIPLAQQPLFAHFASVYWNAVLSFYANQKL
jgi:hypothetical protein